MKTCARLLFGVALTVPVLGADCNTTPESPPPPGAWLVLLCRTNDASFDPRPPDFYQAVFSRDSTDLLWQFFNDMSGGTVDVSGTRVRGWFTMGVSSDAVSPAKRNNTTNPNRSATAQDCRAAAAGGLAAQGISVDPAKYTGVISVINQPVDAGAAGGKNVVVSSHFESDLTFVEHEMLHVHGLRHSNRIFGADASADHIFGPNDDRTYNDCWDIMSSATCVSSFQTGSHGNQGPGIQAAYLQKLGWIPDSRVFAPGGAGTNSTITLAPVSERGNSGFLLARIEAGGGNYVVEYRVPTGFDRAVARRSVLIKEERGANPVTYLITRQNGALDWVAGDVFTDTRNWLRIEVTALAANAATVAINTAFAPGMTPGALNETCGDKFTGQTRPCSPGLRCAQRKTGVLVSVDYFCMP